MDSVPYVSLHYSDTTVGNSTDTYDSTTKNDGDGITCESHMLGIKCQALGKPCTVGDTTHILCDLHERWLLRFTRAWYEARNQTEKALLKDYIQEVESFLIEIEDCMGREEEASA